MRYRAVLGVALLVASSAAGPAVAANMCQAENLTCATTMPVGGYCECTSRGQTQSGTVVARAQGRRTNSAAGGCGTNPNSPGCR